MSLNVKAQKRHVIVLSIDSYQTFDWRNVTTYNAVIESTLSLDEINNAVGKAKKEHFMNFETPIDVMYELDIITQEQFENFIETSEFDFEPEDFILIYLKLAKLIEPTFWYKIVTIQQQYFCRI
jgi:hypothetical protein